MGTGYTRNDTGNNIADGNVINASDFDGEFDAINLHLTVRRVTLTMARQEKDRRLVRQVLLTPTLLRRNSLMMLSRQPNYKIRELFKSDR